MFIVPKLHFFRYIASLPRTFLYSYQTDSPMTPFISSNLYFDLKQLMNVIILKVVLHREVTHFNLDQFIEKHIYIPLNNLNLGTATKFLSF